MDKPGRTRDILKPGVSSPPRRTATLTVSVLAWVAGREGRGWPCLMRRGAQVVLWPKRGLFGPEMQIWSGWVSRRRIWNGCELCRDAVTAKLTTCSPKKPSARGGKGLLLFGPPLRWVTQWL